MSTSLDFIQILCKTIGELYARVGIRWEWGDGFDLIYTFKSSLPWASKNNL